MDIVIKVTEDLLQAFRERTPNMFNQLTHNIASPGGLLSYIYAVLLNRCPNEFIEYMRNYKFSKPADFIKDFWFNEVFVYHSDGKFTYHKISFSDKYIYELLKANVYSLGSIENPLLLYVVLKYDPEFFKELLYNHSRIINITTNLELKEGPREPLNYPDDDTAVELFLKKCILPSAVIGINCKESYRAELICSHLLNYILNVKKEILEEVLPLVFKKLNRENFWICLSSIYPLLEKYPEFFLTMVQSIFRKHKRKNRFTTNYTTVVPIESVKVYKDIVQKAFKVLSNLPEEVVETLIKEEMWEKIEIPTPLWIPLLNNKCFRNGKYTTFGKYILLTVLQDAEDVLKTVGISVYIPQELISKMDQDEKETLVRYVSQVYGTKVFFPPDLVPTPYREYLEALIEIRKYIKQLIEKYLPAENKMVGLIRVVKLAYEKGLSHEEVDIIIDIMLKLNVVLKDYREEYGRLILESEVSIPQDNYLTYLTALRKLLGPVEKEAT